MGYRSAARQGCTRPWLAPGCPDSFREGAAAASRVLLGVKSAPCPPCRPLPQDYSLLKRAEHACKAVALGGAGDAVSVCDPHTYSQRFLRMCSGLFVCAGAAGGGA